MIGRAGALAALAAVAAPLPDDGPKSAPASGVGQPAVAPPLKPLRPDRPTPAQRVMPGLH